MNITGGTYFLNALALDYPLIEWVETAKSFCDEIILVDMGSTDGTIRAIRNRFGSTVSIIREEWHFDKNYHEGKPRNKILEAAQMQWIYLTDADEILHEKYFDTVRYLVKGEHINFYRFGLIDFYGSCYLRRQSKSEKPALIRNGIGFYFGPVSGKVDKSAHTLLVGGKMARKWQPNRKIGEALYHYGRCRSARGIAAAHKFYTLQAQARQGLSVDLNACFEEKDHIISEPNLKDNIFVRWTDGHPKVMQKWVKKHWKIHGWEA